MRFAREAEVIRAVDNAVILDILLDDEVYADTSVRLIEEYLVKGALIMSPVMRSTKEFCDGKLFLRAVLQ